MASELISAEQLAKPLAQAHAITQQHRARVERCAVTVEHRGQINEAAAAPRVLHQQHRRVAAAVSVEIAAGNQVIVQG